MNKKIIFLDLDGTLLISRNKIGKKTKKIITKLQNNDVKFILISGRPYCATLPVYKELGLNSLMVSDSGACITNPSDEKFITIRKKIPYNYFINFYNNIKPYVETCLYNVSDEVYISNDSDKLDYFCFEATKDKIFRKDYSEFNISPTGLLVLVKDDPSFKDTVAKYNILKARYWGRFNDHMLYEVYIGENNKGEAAKYVLNYLGLSPDQSLAFGDGVNDIELFQVIPGIAMKNAHPELIKASIAITGRTNKKEGLAHHLKKILK